MTQKSEPEVDFGFFAKIPRMVRTGYKGLTTTERWLYACLKDLCGDQGICYRALRTLSEETGISIGMLSESIQMLHAVGLILAEKRRRTNNPTAKDVWHIRIIDIWEVNGHLHPTKECSQNEQKRSQNEQSNQHASKNVQSVNNNVRSANKNSQKRSPNEQQCSQNRIEGEREKDEQIEEKTFEEERTATPSLTPPDASSLNSFSAEEETMLSWLREKDVPWRENDVKTVREQLDIVKIRINTKEMLHKYCDFAKVRNQGKEDKTVYLGNIAKQKLLGAFLQAQEAEQYSVCPQPAEASEVLPELEADEIIEAIRHEYPDIILQPGENEQGPYIGLVYGEDKHNPGELLYVEIRSKRDWQDAQGDAWVMNRAMAYGKECKQAA